MARAMKDSGIPWIGKIPIEWDTIKLCYISESIFLGRTPEYSEVPNSNQTIGQKNNQAYGIDLAGIKYSTDKHASECADSEYLKFGDILLNSLGTGSVGRIGYFNISGGRFLTDGHIIVIRPNKETNGKFIYYYLSTVRKQLEDSAVGSTNQAFLTVPKIYKIRIPSTSKIEQKRIVEFLDTECARIDTVMEQTRASIEEYKKLKQSIITEAVTKGIRPNRPMKDSGIDWIGQIPADWKVTQLKRLCKIQTGSTPSKTDEGLYFSDNEGMPWIKAENLGTILPIRQTSEYLTEEGTAVGRVFPPYTVYVCCIASVGKVGYSDIVCSCNQQINGLVFNELYNWKYGFYVSVAQETEYNVKASGNVMKIINTDKQSNIMCPLPSITEQQQIAAFLDEKCAQIDKQMETKQRLITELESYKKSLIYEYVTGKKEVSAS